MKLLFNELPLFSAIRRFIVTTTGDLVSTLLTGLKHQKPLHFPVSCGRCYRSSPIIALWNIFLYITL